MLHFIAEILLFYLPAFLGYLWLCYRSEGISLAWYLGLAVAARLIILPAMPQLSDDVYILHIYHNSIHL